MNTASITHFLNYLKLNIKAHYGTLMRYVARPTTGPILYLWLAVGFALGAYALKILVSYFRKTDSTKTKLEGKTSNEPGISDHSVASQLKGMLPTLQSIKEAVTSKVAPNKPTPPPHLSADQLNQMFQSVQSIEKTISPKKPASPPVEKHAINLPTDSTEIGKILADYVSTYFAEKNPENRAETMTAYLNDKDESNPLQVLRASSTSHEVYVYKGIKDLQTLLIDELPGRYLPEVAEKIKAIGKSHEEVFGSKDPVCYNMIKVLADHLNPLTINPTLVAETPERAVQATQAIKQAAEELRGVLKSEDNSIQGRALNTLLLTLQMHLSAFNALSPINASEVSTCSIRSAELSTELGRFYSERGQLPQSLQHTLPECILDQCIHQVTGISPLSVYQAPLTRQNLGGGSSTSQTSRA